MIEFQHWSSTEKSHQLGLQMVISTSYYQWVEDILLYKAAIPLLDSC